jgi:asparagine synthase (glutamine-hydrolysing)
MSGFAGIVRIEPGREAAEADRAAIARMAGAIAFRGPDALQEIHQPGASFVFSLLKTGPAAQESQQPCTIDGETWFLGDARCDGRDELIAKLEQHGAAISRSATSEELVLRFFSQFGSAALPELHGDFSFVLWAPAERRLTAYRDLTGARPFFYFQRKDVLSFSNTLQAVLLDLEVSRREYDPQFIGDFLLGSPYHDQERTVYRDIRRLPPGHLLEFSSAGVRVRRIANLPIEDLLSFRRDEEVIERFRQLFTQAVADCLPATDTAVFLSAGLDSTSIAAAAAKLRKKQATEAPQNLRALTLDLQPLLKDQEAALAEQLARKLAIPFELLHIGHILPFARKEEIAALLPEPVPWMYWKLHPYYFSHAARTSRVVLSGYGGDEILRGQGGAYLQHLARHKGYASATAVLLRYVSSRWKLPVLGAGIRSGLSRLVGRSATKQVFPPWFTAQAERTFLLRNRFEQINTPPASAHAFNPRAYSILNGQLFGAGFEDQDPTWSTAAIEFRVPFMDRRLLGFLLRLPPIPWFMEKELLRRAQKGVLPEEIRRRPKVPLRQDPLLQHINTGQWRPQAPQACSTPLQAFVDWQKWAAALENSSGHSLHLNMNPLALALWFEAIENSG